MLKVMTTDELAKYLKLNPDTIRRQAKRQIIPGIRVGRVWRFPKEMIDTWIKEKMGGGETK